MSGKIKLILIFFILSVANLSLTGQYLPKDKAKLNYNQIMFEGPYIDGAKEYTFYIAADTATKIDKNHYLIKQTEKFPVALIKNIPLDKNYAWVLETTLKSGKKQLSGVHTFSILTTKMDNPKLYKAIQHYNKKEKLEDGLIWCDQYRCAVDRNGNIVWFMTEDHFDQVHAKVVRDFKLYDDGTITYINQPNATRVDIDMNEIWKAPYAGTLAQAEKEDYHHELEILPNGNYMVLGNEKVLFSNDTVTSKPVDFCNIIEFDKDGNIVWFWRMKDHFPYELLIDSNVETQTGVANPHANSFCYDEVNNVIYLSYRDISRIIKIDKKTKKIIASYGEKLKDEDRVTETDLFRLQHDIQLMPGNDMLLFNNNDISKGKISCVEIIHLPVNKNDSLYLKWKFDLNYDEESNGKVDRMGGVKKMANGNYLICEGSSNRVVEISPKGELLWDFSLRQVDSTGRVNDKFALYRANFSKSLYPQYVAFYLTEKNEIILLNKGFNSDKFIVNVSDESGKLLFSQPTKELPAGKSIKLKTPIADLEKMKIEIKSTKTGKIRSNI